VVVVGVVAVFFSLNLKKQCLTVLKLEWESNNGCWPLQLFLGAASKHIRRQVAKQNFGLIVLPVIFCDLRWLKRH
jgi:hypothetical protein